MKVQTKISLLLLVLLLFFISGLLFLQYREQKMSRSFFESKLNDKMVLFERILQIEGSPLEIFVADYSARAEVLNFVQTGYKLPIRFTMDNALQSFNIDAVWIYSNDFKLLHSSSIFQDTKLNSLPLGPAEQQGLFVHRSYFRHFFIKTSSGLLEIRSAPVQSEAEREANVPPRGFLFAGRLWTKSYIKNLCVLTDSEITITPVSQLSSFMPFYEPWEGKLGFSKIIESWDRLPLMQIKVVYNAPAIKDANRHAAFQFFLVFIFIVTMLLMLTFSLLTWVRRPLRLLSEAMEKQHTSSLKGVQRHKTEFGRFALLLDSFFKQQEELVREVHERLRAENQLKAANEQLLAREQELEASNEQLMAQEEQLRTSNEQLEETNRDLRRGEADLKASEKRYRELVDTMNDGLAIVDERGMFTYTNDRFANMLKYPREDIISRPAEEFLIAESRKLIREHILHPDKVARRMNGECESFEVIWINKYSEEVITIISPKPVHGRDGSIQGSFSVITDITDIRQAEKETREYKEFLEKIIEGTHDGIMIADGTHRIMSANKAMAELLGKKKEELLGRQLLTVFNEDNRINLHRQMPHSRPGKPVVFESNHIRQDGSVIDLENNFTMIVGDNQEVLGGIVIMRDITERKIFERQMVQSEKLRSLGQLASGVAHDFNNVLAAIIGRVQILDKILEPPPGVTEKRKIIKSIKQNLVVIEKAAMDGAETVHRIQQFSRSRQDDRFFTQVYLNAVVEDALEFTKVRWKDEPEAKGLTIAIQKELTAAVPVTGSPSELREVITNIIHNAIDAMPNGGIIRTKTFISAGHVMLEISDTGVGFSKSTGEKIFEPFFTTKPTGEGTGLGLSLSYDIIVRMHKGEFKVATEEDQFTEFTLVLLKK